MNETRPAVFRPLMRGMAHCPLAMTLWGVQQAVHLMGPGRSGPRAVAAVEAMNRAASGQMGEAIARVYRTGTSIQNGIFDSLDALLFGDGTRRSGLAEAWNAISRPPQAFPETIDLNRDEAERSS